VTGKSKMESKAISRYIRQSPFKVRKTLDSVRGMSVDDALNYLHFSPEKAAKVIEKTIRSAVSNFLNKNENVDVDQNALKIKEAFVDGGPVMKRFRAASMGRASRLRRPTSHLTVVIKSEKKRI
tara:strand:+ start:3027 stop:3398 length:372 start_codon:yes stop_codon:yes gene_type:complete